MQIEEYIICINDDIKVNQVREEKEKEKDFATIANSKKKMVSS